MKNKSKDKKKKSREQFERMLVERTCGTGCPLIEGKVCPECLDWRGGDRQMRDDIPTRAVLD